jgi:hypothetical protein
MPECKNHPAFLKFSVSVVRLAIASTNHLSLIPSCHLNLQKVQSRGVLMVCKLSDGDGIQRCVNWRSVGDLQERERHEEKDRNEQGSNSSIRPNSRPPQGKLKASKLSVLDPTCTPMQSKVSVKKGASHECVLAG